MITPEDVKPGMASQVTRLEAMVDGHLRSQAASLAFSVGSSMTFPMSSLQYKLFGEKLKSEYEKTGWKLRLSPYECAVIFYAPSS